MPIRAILANKLISVGTSFFVLMGSTHYDFDLRGFDSKTLSVTDSAAAVESTNTEEISLKAETISVSCIKLTWNGSENTSYTVTATQKVHDDYIDNLYFEFKSNTLCYVTGLRENSEYLFEIADESGTVLDCTVGRTEAVEVIEEFDYIDGWTNCFTYEAASDLTKNPSRAAICGAQADVVTGTGIMRNTYGDYCCVMGTFYGYCGDRFLVTLENGTQFTVKICDSKGDRRYHDYGTSGKSVIEFIVADNSVPSCVSFTGNYGYYNWSGLNLTANIQSIQKINYGNTVSY